MPPETEPTRCRETPDYEVAIESHQNQIYAFIRTLGVESNVANDILQETNLVLLQKRDVFRQGTSFIAWAYRVAHFQVLAFLRDRSRDKVLFDAELVSILATAKIKQAQSNTNQLQAFDACFQRLSATQQDLISDRYSGDGSLSRLSKKLNRSPGSVSQSLYRIRLRLVECIRRKTGGGRA